MGNGGGGGEKGGGGGGTGKGGPGEKDKRGEKVTKGWWGRAIAPAANDCAKWD